MLTNKGPQKVPKRSMNFYCECCDYGAEQGKSNIDRHLLTAKHEILTNPPVKSFATAVKLFNCECGKRYKHRQSLNSHRKKVQLCS